MLIDHALILGWCAVSALLGIPSSDMTAVQVVWLTSPVVARIVARLIGDRLAGRGGLA
jgi:hypothetical protein